MVSIKKNLMRSIKGGLNLETCGTVITIMIIIDDDDDERDCTL